MFLAYDGMVFDMLFLDGWQVEQDSSSDGVDFLRWHHIIDVTCVLNPAATAAFRFPVVSSDAVAKNKIRADEAAKRLRAKQFKNTITGQAGGEDKKKALAKLKGMLPFFALPFTSA